MLSATDRKRLAHSAETNSFIQSDNLDAMKVLFETHGPRFKLVYMDPPYNTGQSLLYQDATSFQIGYP